MRVELKAEVDFFEAFFVLVFVEMVGGFKEKLIRRHLLL